MEPVRGETGRGVARLDAQHETRPVADRHREKLGCPWRPKPRHEDRREHRRIYVGEPPWGGQPFMPRKPDGGLARVAAHPGDGRLRACAEPLSTRALWCGF